MSRYYRDPTTGNEIPIAGMRDLQDVKNLMLELCYPIGSMYISTVNVSPATFLGGTWIQHEGYVLRGATSNVTAGTQGQTNDGGADSVTVSSVASHNHDQNSHNHVSTTDYNARALSNTVSGSTAMGAQGTYLYFRNNMMNAYNTGDKTATNIANGSNYTVNTLPKYKNVYIWERTA